ncbi:tetratricopeptide repeat protein [archaeon]|nr:MAG: tetratricopeptide repeat protein [archaeon]
MITISHTPFSIPYVIQTLDTLLVAQYYDLLGLYYHLLGQFRKAMQLYAQALALIPDMAMTQLKLAGEGT